MRSMVASPVASLLARVRADVDALTSAVADGALRGASAGELAACVREVRAEQARLESVLLTAVREVDASGAHVEEGALTLAAWLRRTARMGMGEASGCVRTARELGRPELAATAAALSSGEIDAGHAREIARGVAEAPAGAVELIEPEALAVAREADRRAVASVMAKFAHALDPDAADEAAVRRLERRGLTAAPTLDGMVAGSFLADAATGSLILTALDAASPVLPAETRTAAQRRMDAFADICRHYLASGAAPSSGGGHPHVIVTVDAQTLTARPGDTGSPGATISWVGHIPGSTARRIACDADVTTVALDQHGDVVGVDRQRRFFTLGQRRAMIARDGDRCVIPFCDRPVAWADGHHLITWTAGGPTTTANGALPCAAHHAWLHEGHWTLHRERDGRYSLRHPDGRTIAPEPHPPGHNRPPPHRRQ